MGQIEKSTRAARLLISQPSVVYEELKVYSADIGASPYTHASDELEAKLAARNDPLIDLGVASYGASQETIGTIYRKAKAPPTDETDATYKQGLRLAVLANETVRKRSFGRFPVDTIGEEELAFVLKSADWTEAQTLIQNPTIADEVLLALFRGDKIAEGIDDQRRRQLVAVSGQNDRLAADKSDEFGPDLGHWDLHKAIFTMLESVPTSDAWVECLSFLLMQIDPSQVAHPESIDAVLERWTVNEEGEPEKPSTRDDYTHSGQSSRTEFRCLIASLYGRSFKTSGVVVHGSADDPDIVRRSAYYGKGDLDAKAVKAGYDRDGSSFTFAAMSNDAILLNKRLRKIFEEECLTGRQFQRYQRRCAQLHKKWSSFDPRPTAEWMVEKSEEAEGAQTKIMQQMTGLNERLSGIEKTLALVPWLLVALALLVAWRH